MRGAHDITGGCRARRAIQGSRRQQRVVAVGHCTGFVTLLDQAVLDVAIPAPQQGVDATGADLQWMLSVYSLAFGVVLAPAGRLGDVRGRARLLAVGLMLFGIGGVLGALALNPWLLCWRHRHNRRRRPGARHGIAHTDNRIAQFLRSARRPPPSAPTGTYPSRRVAVGRLVPRRVIARGQTCAMASGRPSGVADDHAQSPTPRSLQSVSTRSQYRAPSPSPSARHRTGHRNAVPSTVSGHVAF